MGLADDLLADARFLAEKGVVEQRQSLMRRAVSTAYYAAFHLFIEDFVEHWEFPGQRARLGRMFSHGRMGTGHTAKDKDNPTLSEKTLQKVITAFTQLQKDRERADYHSGWTPVETDVRDAIRLADDVFTMWRAVKDQDVARDHLLTMFGARPD